MQNFKSTTVAGEPIPCSQLGDRQAIDKPDAGNTAEEAKGDTDEEVKGEQYYTKQEAAQGASDVEQGARNCLDYALRLKKLGIKNGCMCLGFAAKRFYDTMALSPDDWLEAVADGICKSKGDNSFYESKWYAAEMGLTTPKRLFDYAEGFYQDVPNMGASEASNQAKLLASIVQALSSIADKHTDVHEAFVAAARSFDAAAEVSTLADTLAFIQQSVEGCYSNIIHARCVTQA